MSIVLAATLAALLVPAPAGVFGATEHASCQVQHRAASIVQPVEPKYPAIAKEMGLTGTSLVRIDLSETGRLLGAGLLQSSDSRLLDAAAIETAKAMVYAPALENCNAVGGSYALEVIFAN